MKMNVIAKASLISLILSTDANAAEPPPIQLPATNQGRTTLESVELQQLYTRGAQSTFFRYLADSPGSPVVENAYLLLGQQNVLNELEVSTYQAAEIATAFSRYRGELGSTLQSYPHIEDQQQEIRSMLKQHEAELHQVVAAVLTPEQDRRLNQIQLEMRIQSEGIVSVLWDPQVAEALGVSELQQKALTDKAAELSRQFDKEVSSMKKTIRIGLIRTLNRTQQAILEDLVGYKFDLHESD